MALKILHVKSYLSWNDTIHIQCETCILEWTSKVHSSNIRAIVDIWINIDPENVGTHLNRSEVVMYGYRNCKVPNSAIKNQISNVNLEMPSQCKQQEQNWPSLHIKFYVTSDT